MSGVIAFPYPSLTVAKVRALLLGVLLAFTATSTSALAQTPGDVQPDSFPTASPPTGTPRAGGPLSVVTTTSLLADLVRQVGGPRVAVETLLPANADPHDYEPAPEDVGRVKAATLVVQHGLGLDAWAERLVDNTGGDFAVVTATEGIPTLSSDEKDFGDGDPHVWFDPTHVQAMVTTLSIALSGVDPEGERTYRTRATSYRTQLTALDVAIAERIATIPPERRKLVTNHDALAYYAERYGLEIVGTVIPSLDTRAEASAREVAKLLEAIAAENVNVIFTEKTTGSGLAVELAGQAGIAIVDDLYTDGLGPPGSDAETYIGLMWYDTTRIVDALRSQ